jgi:hypothetical protein
MNVTLADYLTWDLLLGAESYTVELLNAAAGLILNTLESDDLDVACSELFAGQQPGQYNARVRGKTSTVQGDWSELLPLSFELFGAPQNFRVATP